MALKGEERCIIRFFDWLSKFEASMDYDKENILFIIFLEECNRLHSQFMPKGEYKYK